jgi:hypothetical protein
MSSIQILLDLSKKRLEVILFDREGGKGSYIKVYLRIEIKPHS